MFQLPRKQIGPTPRTILKKRDNNMIQAINSVKEKKMALRKAVKLHSVAQTTLQRFVISSMTPEECVKLKNWAEDCFNP